MPSLPPLSIVIVALANASRSAVAQASTRFARFGLRIVIIAPPSSLASLAIPAETVAPLRGARLPLEKFSLLNFL